MQVRWEQGDCTGTQEAALRYLTRTIASVLLLKCGSLWNGSRVSVTSTSRTHAERGAQRHVPRPCTLWKTQRSNDRKGRRSGRFADMLKLVVMPECLEHYGIDSGSHPMIDGQCVQRCIHSAAWGPGRVPAIKECYEVPQARHDCALLGWCGRAFVRGGSGRTMSRL